MLEVGGLERALLAQAGLQLIGGLSAAVSAGFKHFHRSRGKGGSRLNERGVQTAQDFTLLR